MSDAKAFEKELRDMIDRHMTAGTDPRDIVDAMSRQVSLVIDQSNLELEMEPRPSGA